MKLKKFDTINVIPFIDVMLVLLTITLTAATFVARGLIPIDIPKAEKTQTKPQNSIEITVKEDGSIFFGQIQTDKEGLKKMLADLSVESEVTVRTDRNSKFQGFVDVIDVLKDKNIEKISIATTLQN